MACPRRLPTAALLHAVTLLCLTAAFWGREAHAEKLRIHFVPHTHDDAGWLKTVDQYYVGSRQDIQKAAVEYILDTAVSCLTADANRTFTYAEIAFFERWWRHQTPHTHSKVRNTFNILLIMWLSSCLRARAATCACKHVATCPVGLHNDDAVPYNTHADTGSERDVLCFCSIVVCCGVHYCSLKMWLSDL